MIGGDFDVPIMYQDLANSTMGPMSMPFGGMVGMPGAGMYNTSYLGGVKMHRQPDHDKVQIMNKKEKEDKNTLKKALLVLGGIVLLGSIAPLRKSIKKAGGLGEYLKKGWNSVKNWVTGKKKTP